MSGKSVKARTIIIATGADSRWLGVPNEVRNAFSVRTHIYVVKTNVCQDRLGTNLGKLLSIITRRLFLS